MHLARTAPRNSEHTEKMEALFKKVIANEQKKHKTKKPV